MLGACAVAASWADPRVQVAQIIIAIFLAGTLTGGLVFYSRRLRSFLQMGRLFRWLPLWPMLQRIESALFVYRYHKGKVVVAMVLSWIIQAMGVISFWQVAAALGSQAPWPAYFLIVPVIWIGWSLIPVPGGFGVAETLGQTLFTASVLGLATVADALTMALTIMLAYRVVLMAVGLPGAVLYLMRRTKVSPMHMREEMEAPEADA
jgi:uncharacterized membrane protein YbhN (UPF0104 family)